MFKFQIIESPKKAFRNRLIKTIIEKMKYFQGIELPLKNRINPSFLIAEGPSKKILGGACLLKKKITEIQEDVGELVATLTFNNDYVWECSTIYLEFFTSHPFPDTLEAKIFSQSFYRELYQGFVEFGEKKKVNFIVIKLIAEVYTSTKEFGLWPYVVELKPHNSPDGLFHGILPLTGSQYDAYQEIWETLNLVSVSNGSRS